MSKIILIPLIASFAVLFAGTASAGDLQVYKWVDSQGVVHYSDQAPATRQPDLQQMTLQALPAPDPKALAEDQAWIASINQWYQTVLDDQAQLEYEQLLASQAAPSPAPPSSPEDVEAAVLRHAGVRRLLSFPSPPLLPPAPPPAQRADATVI